MTPLCSMAALLRPGGPVRVPWRECCAAALVGATAATVTCAAAPPPATESVPPATGPEPLVASVPEVAW